MDPVGIRYQSDTLTEKRAGKYSAIGTPKSPLAALAEDGCFSVEVGGTGECVGRCWLQAARVTMGSVWKSLTQGQG